jgi:hypothetical protein
VLAQRGELEAAIDWLSGALDPAEGNVPAQRTLRQDTLWLLSPYLIELRSYRRWKTLYAEVLEARGDSVLLASAGFEQPVVRRLRGAAPAARGLR